MVIHLGCIKGLNPSLVEDGSKRLIMVIHKVNAYAKFWIYYLEASSRESFSPHPLHSKTVRLSFRQSDSRPKRSSFSPHRHSSTMLFEQGTKCSGITHEPFRI
jgi:hypothetical protein